MYLRAKNAMALLWYNILLARGTLRVKDEICLFGIDPLLPPRIIISANRYDFPKRD
jgi:hypothetical protein